MMDPLKEESTSLVMTDAEKWSQDVNITSIPDERELEEVFSVPFEPDEENWSQQITVSSTPNEKELED